MLIFILFISFFATFHNACAMQNLQKRAVSPQILPTDEEFERRQYYANKKVFLIPRELRCFNLVSKSIELRKSFFSASDWHYKALEVRKIFVDDIIKQRWTDTRNFRWYQNEYPNCFFLTEKRRSHRKKSNHTSVFSGRITKS